MTPNTSPKKPEWFSLIENDAPSAQVRKVDKRLTVSTALAALAIAASGALFTSVSRTPDSSATEASAGAQKMISPSIGVVDPTLNGGEGDDEYEDDEDEDEDDEDEDD